MRQQLVNRAKRLLKILKSHIALEIPTGMTKFNQWLDDLVELVGPIADAESIRWTACNEIMRLPPTSNRVKQNKLVKIVRKFAANQLAAHTVNQLKAAADERLKAAQTAAAAQPEATTTVASNVKED